MTIALWTLICFLLGSLPLAFWLGRFVLDVDIREYGDGNPGALNAWRAGGWAVGVPGALLDYGKALIPLAVAHYLVGITNWALLPVAVAPVLGHAFSPFLRFRGGKAVAATFGVWTVLSPFDGVWVFGLTLGFFWALQKSDGWTMVIGLLSLFAFLLLAGKAPPVLAIWAVNASVVTWKHRRDLRRPFRWRFRRSFSRIR